METPNQTNEVQLVNPEEKQFLNIYDPEKIKEVIGNKPNAAALMAYTTSKMNFLKEFNEELKSDTPELRKAMVRSVCLWDTLTGIITMREFQAIADAGYDIGFNLIGNQKDWNEVVEQAAVLGISITPSKMLPAPSAEDPDQLQIQFNQDSVKIENEELEKQIKEDAEKRKQAVIEQPEIDHTKIKPDDKDALSKALLYYMNNDVFANAVKDTTDWYRDFLSYHKVKNEDVEANLNIVKAMTIGEIFGEVLDIVVPTTVMSGIGGTIYITAKQRKNIVLPHTVIIKQAGSIFTQEELAEIVKIIIEKKALWNIASMGKKKDEDATVTDVMDDAAFKTMMEIPSSSFIDTVMARETPEAKEVYGRVYNTFYGGNKLSGDEKEAAERQTNIRNIIGCILNLYATSGNRLSEFENLNPNEVIKAQKIKKAE